MIQHIETTDIFRGAFFLCMGGELCGLEINEREIASFRIRGEDMSGHNRDYQTGRALVNPVEYRITLNQLRDILYKGLDERRRRDDRTGKNRRHQAGHRTRIPG